ncbi:MAG: hypothetical protein ABI442_05940 [Gemmatimonadaceae bacterium]
MTRILLVGAEHALLEGLAQTFGALGMSPSVAASLSEARELAIHSSPLVAVISRTLAVEAGADTLGIPLSPGGTLVLYRSANHDPVALPPALQRAVLADLSLPLERNRLVALVQRVEDRAIATGRSSQPNKAKELGADGKEQRRRDSH